MGEKRWSTKTPGVRYKLHPTRRHGVNYDKYFSIRYYVNGKQKEEGVGWSTEGWTEKKCAAILAELKANFTVGDGPRTLEEKRLIEDARRAGIVSQEQKDQATLLKSVFAYYCQVHSGRKSLKTEKSYFKTWIDPAIGHKKLDQIMLLDLERIKKKMVIAGRAPRTIQSVKGIIRQIFHFAIDHRIFSGEVPTARFLKGIKIDNKRQRYLSYEEADALLIEVRKHSLQTYHMSLLALNSAMRFGEISHLLWQHINLSRKEIIIVDTKNGESRAVYMTNAIVQMFTHMEHGAPNALVFPSRKNTVQTRVSKSFPLSVDNLGLNQGITDRRMKFVFHSLRHSCASWLANSDVQLHVISKVLGHKSMAMTMRYAKVSDATMKNAMAILDEKQISKKVVNIKD